MIADLDDNIYSENTSNGQINLSLTGLKSFKEQAEQAKNYFSSRTQIIKSYKHKNDRTEIKIDYHTILATDFPNGLKKEDELKLTGKSIFEFRGDKIGRLTDLS